MSNNRKEQIPEWARKGHAKPTTRREFLAQGMIPFAAATFLPNWMQLLAPSEVYGVNLCPAPTVSGLVPVVQFNLSGGAGLMANQVPMDAGGNPLPSYSKMGLGDGQVPLEREFGNVPFAGPLNGVLISNILAGIRSVATPQTLANCAFISECVQSRDDSRENVYAINGLVNRAGLMGTRLPHLGTQDTSSGIGQVPAVVAPPSPLIVKSFNDVANSLSYTGALAQLNQAQRERLTKLISDLNASQSRKLASITSGADIQKLIECAGVRNVDLVREGAAAVDPRTNPAVAAVWGLAANTAANNQSLVFGTMVYNTLNNQAGSCAINVGGYDYHGNPRATTNQRDRDAGVIIGRILQTAAVMQRPVFLYVTSDGSVSSVESNTDRQAQFNSDRGSAGMAWIFIYHPNGRPVTSGFQIGHYTPGQSAETRTVVGNSPEIATQAAFANWLKLNNRMELFTQVVSRGALAENVANLNSVVKVA